MNGKVYQINVEDAKDKDCFEETERAEFLESDRAEWRQRLNNGLVRLVPEQQVSRIPRSKTIIAPLRMMHTNSSEAVDLLLAKSRLIVPGHLDPQLGEFRTDAPTTTPVAIRLLITTAVSLKWGGKVFDVRTAFLSGNAQERELYARAPRDGLPAS